MVSGGLDRLSLLTPVCPLVLGRRQVVGRRVEPSVVPEGDPVGGGELDLLDRAPAGSAMDELGLVQPVDRLGERVVIAVALRSDRGRDPGVGEALGIAVRAVLDAAVRVMDKPGEVASP